MYYAKPSFCFFCTTTRPYTPTHLATGQGVYTRDRSIHIGRGNLIKIPWYIERFRLMLSWGIFMCILLSLWGDHVSLTTYDLFCLLNLLLTKSLLKSFFGLLVDTLPISYLRITYYQTSVPHTFIQNINWLNILWFMNLFGYWIRFSAEH